MAQLIRVIRVIRGEKNIAVSFSSLLLGIRERFFGHTRTVFWVYAKGRLGVRKRLLAPSFAPARTALKPCPDVAHTLSGRCFQSGRAVLTPC